MSLWFLDYAHIIIVIQITILYSKFYILYSEYQPINKKVILKMPVYSKVLYNSKVLHL